MNKLIPLERDEEETLCHWAKLKQIVLVKIENEGKRSWYVGKKMKSRGLTKGFPDFFLFKPVVPYCGLAIELKRIKNYVISPEQKYWNKKLNEDGYSAHFAFGADHAIKIIENYLALERQVV